MTDCQERKKEGKRKGRKRRELERIGKEGRKKKGMKEGKRKKGRKEGQTAKENNTIVN